MFFQRVGLVSLVLALWGFFIYYFFGAPAMRGGAADSHLIVQAQTAAFMSVMWVHLGYLFTARRIHDSVLRLNPFSNRWILLGAALTLVCQLAITYLPALQGLFRTAPFPASWWWLVAAGAIPGFLVVELEKYLRRRHSPPEAVAA
jgi:magnesium-transporting ATPase (P-type)